MDVHVLQLTDCVFWFTAAEEQSGTEHLRRLLHQALKANSSFVVLSHPNASSSRGKDSESKTLTADLLYENNLQGQHCLIIAFGSLSEKGAANTQGSKALPALQSEHLGQRSVGISL